MVGFGIVLLIVLIQIKKYSNLCLLIFGLCILTIPVKFMHSRIPMVIQTTSQDSPDKFTKLFPIEQAAQLFLTYRN